MPRVYTEAPETWASITRPVSLAIVRQVARLLTLPKDTRIVLPGTHEELPLFGSVLEQKEADNYFGYDGRLMVEMTEEYAEDAAYTNLVTRRGNIPVFHDPKLGIRISPVYAKQLVNLDMTYRAPNRTLAERFRDESRMRSAQGRQAPLHQVSYHYGLPGDYIEFLKDAWTLRESVEGYNEEFLEWIQQHVTERATTLTTLIGTEPNLVIPETQQCVQGWFDFNSEPQPAQRNQEGGAWDLKFQYQFEYDRLIGLAMEYPLMIHNQLIPEQYYGRPNVYGEQYDPHRNRFYTSHSGAAMNRMTVEFNRSGCRPQDEVVTIPDFDDWEPTKITFNDHFTLMTVLLQLDLEDRGLLLDLNELGDWQIDPDVMQYILDRGDNNFRHRESLVNIQLYRNDDPLDPKILSMDDTGIIRCTQDLDPRQVYHLRISLNTDVNTLSPDAFLHLSQSGMGGLKIIKTIAFKIKGQIELPRLVGGNVIPKQWIRNWGFDIRSSLKRPVRDREYSMLTVGFFTIQANRRGENPINPNLPPIYVPSIDPLKGTPHAYREKLETLSDPTKTEPSRSERPIPTDHIRHTLSRDCD